LRIRALLVSAALVAALGVVAVVLAQEEETPVVPDDATVAALVHWRTQALTLVTPSLQPAVAAMYADEAVDPSTANTASAAKTQAEQAAWAMLDKTSAHLIENYFSQVQGAQLVGATYNSED
jgi:hypothetical protein